MPSGADSPVSVFLAAFSTTCVASPRTAKYSTAPHIAIGGRFPHARFPDISAVDDASSEQRAPSSDARPADDPRWHKK